MSLKVLIDHKEAILPVDVEISIQLHNLFFDDRSEDATYPLTLNLPANRHIFGFPERFNANPFRTEYPGSVYFGPYHLLEGNCIITDVSHDEIELFITTDKHTFWGKSQNSNFQDLDLGLENFENPDEMLEALKKSLSDRMDYIACPLLDPSVSTRNDNLYKPFYNFLPPVADSFFDERKFKRTIKDKSCIFIPFLRLSALIKKIVLALGYNPDRNDLLLNPEFDDIIVLCRRNILFPDSDGACSFQFNWFVPAIPVSDFLLEIEKKFGCRFIANEGKKSISVISDKNIDTIMYLDSSDTLEKHVVAQDDRRKSFIFKDKENADTYIKKYFDKKKSEYIYGDNQDAEQIECISNITGVDTSSEHVTSGLGGEGSYDLYFEHAAVDATYNNTSDYEKTIQTELRLAVYRGNVKNPDLEATCAFYPVATGIPLNYADNKMSLLWKDENNLFDRYHRYRCDIIKKIQTEEQLTIVSKPAYLNDLQKIFTNILAIRNRYYRCYEQEIKFSQDHIIGYILKCYPD